MADAWGWSGVCGAAPRGLAQALVASAARSARLIRWHMGIPVASEGRIPGEKLESFFNDRTPCSATDGSHTATARTRVNHMATPATRGKLRSRM